MDIRVSPHADSEELERLISEEWAPASRNMTFEASCFDPPPDLLYSDSCQVSYGLFVVSYQFKQKTTVRDNLGNVPITVLDKENPWWNLFQEAVRKAGRKLGKPEIFPAATDARYLRNTGLPAIGFSPMANTPILLHDHNEVGYVAFFSSKVADMADVSNKGLSMAVPERGRVSERNRSIRTYRCGVDIVFTLGCPHRALILMNL